MRLPLVLIHGWGLNEEVWFNLSDSLSEHYELHFLSLPGYGKLQGQEAPQTLDGLAEALLEQAPESAIWCGWSLGGMAAIRSALTAPERIQALNLLCTTPKFVADTTWNHGTDIETFTKFADDLTQDYQRGIQRFLLLQSGKSGEAKTIAKQAAKALSKHPAPSSDTLLSGLEILKSTDLRPELANLNVPCHVVSGRRDRVAYPEAARYMAEQISGACYSELNAGHAPHLSHPNELISVLLNNVSESAA